MPEMPDHRFCYPRVVPAAVARVANPDPGTEHEIAATAARQTAPLPRSQRELVAASLARCPPRDGRLPAKLTR
jgi:hypothetical protein